MKSLTLLAGERAKAHLAKHGLAPADVFAVSAAAGGPKGLILQGLDHYLFNDWFSPEHIAQRENPLQLIGASIGSWRMAAACSPNPSAAFNRLAEQYCEAQRYPKGVKVDEITQTCSNMLNAVIGGEASALASPTGKQLMIWVNRGKKPLYHKQDNRARKRGFVSATLANSFGRPNLATYFERWVFSNGPKPIWMADTFDGMDCRFEALASKNIHAAMLASGSIPFVLNAVPSIPNAAGGEFKGPFWDGGLTDYHLALPYHRSEGLVLYPHFSSVVTPGWLDKFLKKRKAKPEWMSNVILLCPSEEFVQSLPAKKIPDRSDFKRYGLDHDTRIQHWKAAIAESQRLAEEFSAWLEKPDLQQVQDF